MSNDKPKDPMVKFKSVRMGQNSKGGDRITLSLDKAEVEYLLEKTAEEVTERGINIDVHVSERQTNDGSRTFLSGIAFIKGIQEFGAGKSQAKPDSAAAPAKSALRDRVASLKNQQPAGAKK